MNYPELRLHILEIFGEAQSEASARRASVVHAQWGEQWRSGRFGFPAGKTEIGVLPVVVTCIKCGHGITSSDPKVVRGHTSVCGLKQKRSPQRKPR